MGESVVQLKFWKIGRDDFDKEEEIFYVFRLGERR